MIPLNCSNTEHFNAAHLHIEHIKHGLTVLNTTENTFNHFEKRTQLFYERFVASGDGYCSVITHFTLITYHFL